MARKAARSKFTPTELTEIARRLRAEKEMKNSVVGPSQSGETGEIKTVLGSKTTNTVVEKQTHGQVVKANG